MPFSEQSREDLSWTLKEIVDGGGDGSISEVRFGWNNRCTFYTIKVSPANPLVGSNRFRSRDYSTVRVLNTMFLLPSHNVDSPISLSFSKSEVIDAK
jgi:hypothetical protein